MEKKASLHFTAIITIMGLIFTGIANGQNAINLRFTLNHNGSFMPLDSILVANINQDAYTMLYYPDTTLTVDLTTGMKENMDAGANALSLSSNYPNPFEEKTYVDVCIPRTSSVEVLVSDVTGRLVSRYDNILHEGSHQFAFYPGSGKIYFLSVVTDGATETIKMIRSGGTNGGDARVEYQGFLSTSATLQTLNDRQKSTNTDFPVTAGDTLHYIGYTTHGVLYSDTIIDKPTGEEIYTFETAWEYLDEPLAGLDLVYNTFYYDGSYMRMYPMIMDMRADDVQNSTPWNNASDVETYKQSIFNPFIDTPWQTYYNGILRANQVIEYVPGIAMGETLRTRIVGEARFLRALFYGHLLSLYYNVPLITSLPTEREDFFPSTATPGELTDQIILDLIEAGNALPPRDVYQGADIGRATKGAAAGFLGKLYAIAGQWAEAASVLRSIIDGGEYALMADYRDNFTLDKENNVESLFEIQNSKSAGGTTRGWGSAEIGPDLDKTSAKAKSYAPMPYGWGDVVPTDWIFEEFQKEKTTDGKDDLRLIASVWYAGNDTNIYGDTTKNITSLNTASPLTRNYKTFIRKYLNKDPLPEQEWRSEINERLLRYAEVLLLYAEALNELGQTTEAYPYIQQVRTRAGLPVLGGGITQEEMREQIAHERALEFCFESIRYIDLLRWGWFADTGRLTMLKERDSNYNYYVGGKEFLPIPQQALDKNPNLVQNPGW